MRALKLLLDSMGIKIDAQEIETAWAKSKDALPQLAVAFDQMNNRIAAMQLKIDQMYAAQNDFNTRMADSLEKASHGVSHVS